MIKALIFDCFGVLASEGWLQFRDTYFGKDAATIEQANDAMKAWSLDMLSAEEFMAQMVEVSGETEKFIRDMLFRNRPDEALFGFIRTQKEHYRIGMLSNIQTGRLEHIFSDEQLALFDDLALSFEIGIAKPDPNAFLVAADRLGVLPEECMFVDDQEKNVVAARAQGMTAIVYSGFRQFEADVKDLLQ